MCNPTSTSPNKTSSSTASSSTSPSPASANRMFSSSPTASPASRNVSSANSRSTNSSTAPILKLVASLRNSEETSIRSPPRRTNLSTSPAFRRISVHRLGEESRDDSHGVGQSSASSPLTPPPGSFRPIPVQHEPSNDYEDDEIPCLIDEDHDRYSSAIDTTLDDSDDDHRFPTQRSNFYTPKPPRSKLSSAFAPAATTPAATDQPNDSVPFFVLDWMIEDLVPDHQNPQDLAILLQEQASKTSYRNFSPLRKTKSANTVLSQQQQRSSPVLQRILPWNKPPETTPPGSIQIQQSYRPTTPPSKDLDSETCLETPKSSNRKSCKLRQKQRNTFMHDDDDKCDATDQDLSMPLIPRNLNDSLGECETEASSIVANDSISKFTARVSSDPAKEETLNTTAFASSGTNTATTKKSSSCPQLYQPDETEAHQLRQRAKQQHDRRERRNKRTVFQRSLTLAQGWNNKGLAMAGNGTRAEQQHQQQQQARQYWDSALECWDNALEIYRSLLGESHERVADVQNNRGIALGKLGRFDKAFEALGIALKARKKQQQYSGESYNDTAAPTASAIVSTLHNIANVFRDAGNPSEALRVLAEAQQTLNVHSRNSTLHQKHHSWHQSARLSTAIGHVYYESHAWREARSAYGEALTTYNQLQRSLLNHSESLNWNTSDEEDKRREVVQHQQLIQQEVTVLEKDLDELDRSQQAKDGSRARLLQTRMQQQQQQQKQHWKSNQAPRSSSQSKQQQSLLGIVSSLRA